MTCVVNIREEPFDVYIGRQRGAEDGYFGNPFPLQRESDRAAVIKCYETYFRTRIQVDPEFKRRILSLQGKRLGCFCKPKDCHGDVIISWLRTQITT